MNAMKEVVLSNKKSLTKTVLEGNVEKQKKRIEIRNRVMKGA